VITAIGSWQNEILPNWGPTGF